MNDGFFGPDQGLERALNQLLAGLNEDLQPDIFGRALLLDETPVKGELGIRRRRKANLDLLEAAFYESLKEFELLADVHRDGQRLVAIPKVHAAPDGGPRQRPVRPLAVGQRHRWKPAVLGGWIFKHGSFDF